MQGEQALSGQLARAGQVVQVGPGVLAAGRAAAVLIDRLPARAVGALVEIEAPALRRRRHQRRAVSREPGGRGAVEGVHAGADGVHQVVDVTDAEEVARWRLGQPVEHPAHHLADLILLLPQRSADGDAVNAGGARHLRRGLCAQVLVHAALDDSVEELPGGSMLAPPSQAAVEPALCALHRARGVVALHVERRALVEGQGDVRAQVALNLHRGLRPHEALGAVEVGTKADTLLLDREHHRLARIAAALDLLGNRAVPHGEHLVAARVGDHRPAPAHELVHPAQIADQLGSGLDEQMEGVPQHQLVAELRHLGGMQ